MLLRRETNYFVPSLKHYSVLIFNFSNKNRDCKFKIFSKNLRNQKTFRYQKNSLQSSYDSTNNN